MYNGLEREYLRKLLGSIVTNILDTKK